MLRAASTALLLGSGAAVAETSAQLTVATDYIFRGIRETFDHGAVQLGVRHEGGNLVCLHSHRCDLASKFV